MSIEKINIDSASIAIIIGDTEGHAGEINLDTIEEIQELKSFLTFREIEIRNGSEDIASDDLGITATDKEVAVIQHFQLQLYSQQTTH